MSLLNISPIDARYQQDTKELVAYFSEFALIRYRVFVEIEYLLSLSQIINKLNLNDSKIKNLKNIYFNFSLEDARKIKEIENIKNQLDSKQGKKVKNKEEFKTTLNDLHNALSKG